MSISGKEHFKILQPVDLPLHVLDFGGPARSSHFDESKLVLLFQSLEPTMQRTHPPITDASISNLQTIGI